MLSTVSFLLFLFFNCLVFVSVLAAFIIFIECARVLICDYLLFLLPFYSANTSAVHPLDYRTMEDLIDYSIGHAAQAVIKKQQIDATTAAAAAVGTRDDITATASHTGASVSTVVPWVYPEPRTLAYLLGQDILVHPIVFEADNHTSNAEVHVYFPDVADCIPTTTVARGNVWLDWWEPTNAAKSHAVGEYATRVVPISTYPVYVRKGAFIPLHAMNAVTSGQYKTVEDQLLDATSSVALDRLLFTWFGPSTAADASHPVQFSLRESVSEGNGMVASAHFSTSNTIEAQISARTGKTAMGAGIQLVGVTEPSAVNIEAWPGSRCVHEYAQRTATLTVSCASVAGGLKVTVSGVSPTL